MTKENEEGVSVKPSHCILKNTSIVFSIHIWQEAGNEELAMAYHQTRASLEMQIKGGRGDETTNHWSENLQQL